MADSRALRIGVVVLALLVLLPSVAVGVSDREMAAGAFRTRHFELQDLRRNQLPWTGAPTPRLPNAKPRDKHGVPMFLWRDGRRYYRPGAIAINGMKRIDAYLDKGDPRQLALVHEHAKRLRKLALVRRNAWWIPTWFDYPDAAQRAPWFDAMTQGLVISFFVRMWRLTGDRLHLDSARKVLRSFTRLPGRYARTWVSHVDGRGYLWLEHYPRLDPDHVLNAHVHAIIGIYEFWQVTRSRKARRLLEGAITTMRDNAERYRRRGRTSLYQLGRPTSHLKYHEIHVWQFKVLASITGDRWFWRFARRLADDVKPHGVVPGKPRRMLRPS